MIRPRGGVSCLIRPTCMEFVKDIDKSQSDLITLILIGDHRIFGNYIPPADSIYFKDEMFTLIVNQFLPLKQNLVVLGAGDINCRIVNAVRKPSPDSNYRDNPDKEINSHDKFLVEISKSFKCFPLNNLTYKDKVFDGKYTFHKGNKKSQNDIILGNHTALDNVEKFIIHEISFNPSDDFPVVTICNILPRADNYMTKAATDLLSDASEYCSKRANKIRPKDVNWGNYKAIELLQDSIVEVGRSPTQELFDESINKFSTVLYNAANTCIVQENTRNHGTYTEVVNLPFNDLLKESNKALSKYLTGAAGADEWHTAKSIVLKENMKVHFGKIANHWASLISTQDSKQIWEAIN